MADQPVTFTVAAEMRVLRCADGLVAGARVVLRHEHVVLGDLWYWLDRDTDDLAELRPYRIGMLGAGSR